MATPNKVQIVGTPDSGSLRGKGAGTEQLPSHVGRTIVTEQVSCQRDGSHSPKVVSTRFYRLHAESVQPDEQEILLTQQWASIDLGRIKVPGLILITNDETAPLPKKPVPGAEFTWPDSSIEIGWDTNVPDRERDQYSPPRTEPFSPELIPPGESHRITPSSPAQATRLRLRARKGTIRATVFIFSV